MDWIITDGPDTTPISVSELKTYASIETSDHDTMLASLIASAVDYIERQYGLACITQTRRYTTPGPPLDLLTRPIQSVTTVQYDLSGTWTTIDSDVYQINVNQRAAGLEPQYGQCWPMLHTGYKTTAVFGFGDASTDVPDGIRTALLMICAKWYNEPTGEVPEMAHRLLDGHRVARY